MLAGEAGAGTPRAARRRLRSVQGADPGRHRWLARSLHGVRREPHAEPSPLKSGPAHCKNAHASNKGQGRGQGFLPFPPLSPRAGTETGQQPRGSSAEHDGERSSRAQVRPGLGSHQPCRAEKEQPNPRSAGDGHGPQHHGPCRLPCFHARHRAGVGLSSKALAAAQKRPGGLTATVELAAKIQRGQLRFLYHPGALPTVTLKSAAFLTLIPYHAREQGDQQGFTHAILPESVF